VIYRDYAHWLQAYALPLPDVRWHEGLFNVKRVPPHEAPHAAEGGATYENLVL
jgi:hypothetical protein